MSWPYKSKLQMMPWSHMVSSVVVGLDLVIALFIWYGFFATADVLESPRCMLWTSWWQVLVLVQHFLHILALRG